MSIFQFCFFEFLKNKYVVNNRLLIFSQISQNKQNSIKFE